MRQSFYSFNEILAISNITSLSSEEQEENSVELERSQTFNGCAWRNTLPLARSISHHFHTDADIPSPDVTHMVTQWGQFLDHDILMSFFSIYP